MNYKNVLYLKNIKQITKDKKVFFLPVIKLKNCCFIVLSLRDVRAKIFSYKLSQQIFLREN